MADRLMLLFEILAGAAGHLLFALCALAAIGATLWLQFREYRRDWHEARASWWAIKLGVPVGGLLVVGLALFMVRGSQGFTGLAVFYGGIGLWLLAGPFVVATIVARISGVPRALALRAAGTLVALLVVVWFGGASAATSLVAAFRPLGDLDARVEYEAYSRILESTPPQAGAAVRRIEARVYALPDEQRLVHLAWRVDPTLEFHGLRVRVDGPGGASPWSSTIGYCRGNGELHLTNVLDQARWLEVRAAWHRGTPESALGVEERIESAPGDLARLPWLDARLRGGNLEVPIPLPASLLDWQRPDSGRNRWVNHARSFGTGAFSRACLFPPVVAPEAMAAARITHYSEELHERVYRDVFAPP